MLIVEDKQRLYARPMAKRRELTTEELEWAAKLKRIWLSKKDALGLTQASAADKMDMTQGAVGQYLNGNIPLNDSASMEFARILEVKVSDFRPDLAEKFRGVWEERGDYAIGNVRPAYDPPTTRKAPVISHVQAGGWSEAIDIFAPGYAERWEPVPETACPNAFWLEVRGDSMTAPAGLSIPEGYLVLVEPSVQEENGSLVVAKLDDENEATFKKLVIDGPNKYLKPLNPDYRTITINGNCRIVGTVTEVKMKLR